MPGYGQLGMGVLGGTTAAVSGTSPEVRVLKADAGTGSIGFYSDGVLRGQIQLDANENTVIQPPARPDAGAGSTTAVRGGIPSSGAGGALQLSGADGVGTDVAGGAVNVNGGARSGSAAGGSVLLRPGSTTHVTLGRSALDNLTFGIFGTAAATRQTVSGSRGSNAALASLLTALATYGLVTDSSSA